MEEEQRMRQAQTKEEKQAKWDRITSVLNNLKDWSWDVILSTRSRKKMQRSSSKLLNIRESILCFLTCSQW
jgi:hypothetical protein